MAGLAAAFGSGSMTNPIGDIEKAGTILVTGSNTTENHPVLSNYIKRAVIHRGAKLIVADPRRIKLTEFAHHWLRPNLGTDVAWINGLMHVILEEGLHDRDFVRERTKGFEELKRTVEKYTPDYVEGITGIPAGDIIDSARTYARGKPGSILYCMGITQHTSGTDNVKSLANLAMLCGYLGVEGGGVNPLRGQNNVQGSCDMGGLPNVYSGYQPVTDDAARGRMEEAWGVSGLPVTPGLTVTEMLPKAHEGVIKALYVIGENPLVTDADLNHAEQCFSHLEFLVVQDIFLTETAKLAHVVLPSKCFAEKEGTFTNTERKVQLLRKAVEAPKQAMDDWKIICRIAGRMGHEMDFDSSRAVMEEIAGVTPSYAGINYDRIAEEGIPWPCPSLEHPGTPILHVGEFPRGKGVFHPIDHLPPAELADDEYPMYMTTGRVLYQYHSGTMTRKTQGIEELAPGNFVEISPQDAEKYRVEDGALVDVKSRRGSVPAKVRISSMAVSGTVFMPFHFAEAAANKLTHAALDPVSGIPEYKVCAVKLTQPVSGQ